MAERIPWLADELRARGLTVVEEPGWKGRGKAFGGSYGGKIVGAMQHHTVAIPYGARRCYPKPEGRRNDGLSNCNVLAQPDGTLHMITDGYAGYSSGHGSRQIFNDMRKDVAPTGTARKRGLVDDFYIARYVINCEAVHAGDGGPMPDVQENALVVMWAAIFTRLGFTPARLVDHTEYTRRKVDARWNGPSNRSPYLREQIAYVMGLDDFHVPSDPITPPEGTMPDLPTLKLYDGYRKGRPELKPNVQVCQNLLALNGFLAANTFGDGDEILEPEDFVPDGYYGPGTEGAVSEFQAAAGLAQDGVCGDVTWTELLRI
jgi:hypothetical protein